jgi:hypothetical protein
VNTSKTQMLERSCNAHFKVETSTESQSLKKIPALNMLLHQMQNLQDRFSDSYVSAFACRLSLLRILPHPPELLFLPVSNHVVSFRVRGADSEASGQVVLPGLRAEVQEEADEIVQVRRGVDCTVRASSWSIKQLAKVVGGQNRNQRARRLILFKNTIALSVRSSS